MKSIYEEMYIRLSELAEDYFNKFLIIDSRDYEVNKKNEMKKLLNEYLEYSDNISYFRKNTILNEKKLWQRDLEKYGEQLLNIYEAVIGKDCDCLLNPRANFSMLANNLIKYDEYTTKDFLDEIHIMRVFLRILKH